MRYLIKFSKESNIKFISHLDLMRTIQKIIKRAALPIEYSKGFNPHMTISIAQPLSVGVYSSGEYMDVVLKEELDENEIKERLSNNVPSGVKILEVVKVKSLTDKKVPQSMAAIEAAKYEVAIKYTNSSILGEELKKLPGLNEWNVIKKSKSGEKEVNIKPLIKEFKYKLEDNILKLQVLLSAGSSENLSADLLGKFIKENTTGVNEEAFVDIQRKDMYGLKNNKYIPLIELLSSY